MSMWEESVTAPLFFAHRLSYCELLDENMVKGSCHDPASTTFPVDLSRYVAHLFAGRADRTCHAATGRAMVHHTIKRPAIIDP